MSESEHSNNYYAKCEESIKQDTFLNEIHHPEAVKKKIQMLKNKLATLDEQMPYILEEYEKYYVFLHKNPEYPEYQQMFANAQTNLTKIGSEFFTISNKIDVDTDLLNKRLICLNAMIVKEKRENTFLKRRLGIIENKSNASSELIYDYKQMYDEGYLRNWALIISIIIAAFSIKNIYSNSTGDMTSNLKNITNTGSSMYNNMKNMGKNMGNNMGKNMGNNQR